MNSEERAPTRRERRAEIARSRGGAAEFLRGRNLAERDSVRKDDHLSSSSKKYKSSRAENYNLVLRRRKIGAFFLVLLGISIFLVMILSQLAARVSASVDGVQDLDAKYASAINHYFDRQPFERLIPQLKKADLLVSVQREFPEVEDIESVNFRGFGAYDFRLKMRRAVAEWSVSGRTLFVDENGIAFENNFFETPQIKVIDEGISQARGGVNVAGGGFMRFAGRLIAAANASGLAVSEIKIPANTLRQVEVRFENINFVAKFSTAHSAEGQVANFERARKFFESNALSPQYVDLRIEGKGYYR